MSREACPSPASVMRANQIHPARIIEKIEETPGIYTYRLQFEEQEVADCFAFAGGQFNMLYIYGVGEVPISIVSDPKDAHILDHTIRVVGRVTEVIGQMDVGDVMGVRGPFGSGWPLEEARGKDVLVVTGGLGCAPVVGAIEYMFRRRKQYGHIRIMHGVKTPRDLLYRERFDAWRKKPDTEVLLASDQPEKTWHYHTGVITELFDMVEMDPANTIVMMCGPEIMMKLAARHLIKRGLPDDALYLSMERNMQCGIGLCGHCQIGPYFSCRDGPVMRYDLIAQFLARDN
jgi:sulfhydrogenase subunit gamma (sulfur reductase)